MNPIAQILGGGDVPWTQLVDTCIMRLVVVDGDGGVSAVCFDNS